MLMHFVYLPKIVAIEHYGICDMYIVGVTFFFLKNISKEVILIIFFTDGILMGVWVRVTGKSANVLSGTELNNDASRDFDDLGGKFNNDINQMLT